MTLRLGELMVKSGLITMDQLTQAVEEQKKNGGKLGQILVRLGFLSEDELVEYLSRQFRIRMVNLSRFNIQPSLTRLVPAALAKKFFMIPIQRVGSTLTIAMTDPGNMVALDDVKFMTGYNIEPVLATESSVLEAIKQYYGNRGLIDARVELDAKDYLVEETPEPSPFEAEEEESLLEEDFEE